MSQSNQPIPADVVHRPERRRFELTIDGRVCHADYLLDGTEMTVHHTEVPPALRGRGLAAVVVQAVFDHAASNGLTVRPLCSYVRAWTRRHPEVSAMLA